MSDEDKKEDNSRKNQTNVIADFCIAEVNFDVEDVAGDSESKKD